MISFLFVLGKKTFLSIVFPIIRVCIFIYIDLRKKKIGKLFFPRHEHGLSDRIIETHLNAKSL